MYGLRAVSRLSLLVRIQSRTAFKTASLLVRDAIRDLLNNLFSIRSNVGIWGIGVKGVLTSDNRAGNVGVVIREGFAAPGAFEELGG